MKKYNLDVEDNNEDYDEEDDEEYDYWDEYYDRKKRSGRKVRYAFAGIMVFFMWLVHRDKKNEEK